ncbi:unnamed protein product [Phytophthora fragariaefolia]|uniref:Unnamed protein product n=1 Tax=Phytophthora fragariaefolia TaxID=1490495 RepID=A0A9W7CZN2_9STRA|nr:unnamed protein product [Phytophthora fragariaefolia]
MLSLHLGDEYDRSDNEVALDLQIGESRGYWERSRPEEWFKSARGELKQRSQGLGNPTPRIAYYHRPDPPAWMDLLPGESRGYWKHHAPVKWFRQVKAAGKTNNEKAVLLLDTGAEVSIVDTSFARKVGCYIDTNQSQECVGIGENVYTTEARTRIKITLAGSLVYHFDIWAGDLAGQEAILGMDFMVPAGIRLDLADGSICLPDEVKIELSGRRQLYNDKAKIVCLDQYLQIEAGSSIELSTRLKMSGHEKLWLTRWDRWVPTVIQGLGKIQYLQLTNISSKPTLHGDERIGIWLAGDRVP